MCKTTHEVAITWVAGDESFQKRLRGHPARAGERKARGAESGTGERKAGQVRSGKRDRSAIGNMGKQGSHLT